MRRRMGSKSPTRHRRLVSDFALNENGDSCSNSADKRSKPFLKGFVTSARLQSRQLRTEIGRRSYLVIVLYVITCISLVWVGSRMASMVKGITIEKQSSSHRRALSESVGPTLAYGIMVYQRTSNSAHQTFRQFQRMFEALYDEENTYVLHVDIKSEKELRDSITNFTAPLNNTHQVPSVSVSWGGVTVVERTLALMKKALEVDDSWRFFVNLGHEDYPSVSQTEARRWMSKQPDGTNFIKCWNISGHDFFGQMERHDSRVQDVHIDDFQGDVREYRSLAGRPGSMERPKSTEFQFFKSLQQTMLSRQLSEYATDSSEARRLLLYMATSKAPDELYFPTLTQMDERFKSMATCDDTRHFSYWIRPGGSWHPEYLTLNHLPLVLDASEFYIRKLDETKGSLPLLEVLDSLRRNEPFEDSVPLLRKWLNREEATGGPLIYREDWTLQEALDELRRRQEEEAEAKRALFVSAIMRRHRKRIEAGVAKKRPDPITREDVAAAGAKSVLQGEQTQLNGGGTAAIEPGVPPQAKSTREKAWGKRRPSQSSDRRKTSFSEDKLSQESSREGKTASTLQRMGKEPDGGLSTAAASVAGPNLAAS